MIRLLSTLLTLALGVYGFWFLSNHYPDVTTKIVEHLDIRQFHALEMKYTASQLMDKHRGELFPKGKSHYLAPLTEFYPYALMEVKYTPSAGYTKESLLLWDLSDGEAILNGKYWDKTHGFGDCLSASASHFDFKVLHFLSSKGGSVAEEQLLKGLFVDARTLKGWITSCLKKKLIIQNGSSYRLHFQNPKLRITPETQLEEKLLIKPLKESPRLPSYFSLTQVEKMANCAFGENFTIRKITLIYLPVHNLIVQNPDGSVQTTLWNAFNGRPFIHSSSAS
ncbi:hypothetical protein [Rhabdochlamydiaceae symbiont of Dictyostelium giganteum]|uniref:hypothetical protein n=1 Tax=Rhabdochlamydiaceae symbiont of Dictyostelium giganteum TaxID=3342349 RepID=UPI00384FA6F5